MIWYHMHPACLVAAAPENLAPGAPESHFTPPKGHPLKRRHVDTALIINMLYNKDILHDVLLGYLIASLILFLRFATSF